MTQYKFIATVAGYLIRMEHKYRKIAVEPKPIESNTRNDIRVYV